MMLSTTEIFEFYDWLISLQFPLKCLNQSEALKVSLEQLMLVWNILVLIIQVYYILSLLIYV